MQSVLFQVVTEMRQFEAGGLDQRPGHFRLAMGAGQQQRRGHANTIIVSKKGKIVAIYIITI